MEGLLNAANVSSDKFLIGELPVNSGDVSIMTLEELNKALHDLTGQKGYKYDPSYGYNTSTYYIYAVNDTPGGYDAESKSTPDNLKEVGITWYQKLNKPTTNSNHWANAGDGSHSLFGGPLYGVDNQHGISCFGWYYSETAGNNSGNKDYWNSYVYESIYVAVVHS